jgi:hypothetical protein
MRVDDLAAQSKIAGINVRREGRIARPYILRGDQKPFGRPPPQSDRCTYGRAEAALQSQSGAGGKKTRDTQPVLECRAGQELDSSIMSGGKQRKRDAASRDVFSSANGRRSPAVQVRGQEFY